MEDESDGGVSTSTLEISQPETQFIPQEDDAEILWEVIEITAEKGKLYRVRWAGNDPKTRKPWPMSWVPKHDCTNDLVLAWKRQQAYKKKEAEQKKSAKRGHTSSKKCRGSAKSLTSAGTSRGGSAASSSNTAGTTSWTHSNATATPRAGPSKLKSLSPSKLASTSNHKSFVTVNPNGKRTHSPPPPPSHSLLDDEVDDDSLPEVVTLTEAQPRKKRKIEVEAVAATEHEPGISQESHEIRPAGIARRGKVLPVEEEEEGEGEIEVSEIVKKTEASRAQARLRDQASMKHVPVKPKLSKGKGRAIQFSEDGHDQDQDLPAPLRVLAVPPSEPTPKELEKRKAQAIAKKKSQLAQALRDRQPNVDRQLPKRASSSKSLTTAVNATLKKPVASTSTGIARTRKREIHPDGDDANGETDFDILPPRKKPSSRQTASSSAVQGDAPPRMDLRRVPSTTSTASKSKPKSKADLKLAQQGNKPVATPLLSPNALAQLGEFDRWITESERKARGEKRTRAGYGSANATESEDEDGKGRLKGKASGGRGEIANERPIRAPLFADFGGGDEEVQRMHETVVDFDGNGDGGLGGSGGHSPAPAPAPALLGAPAPAAPVNSVTASTLQRRTPPPPRKANGVQSLARPRLQQPAPFSPPPPHSPQSLEPQTPKNRKDSSGHRDDSYRHGVVPETEAEESSNNTQSQSQSQPIPQSQPESQPQPSRQGVGRSLAPTSTFPELSLVDDGAGGIARANGSGSRVQRKTTTEAVAGSNSDKLRAEATLPDLNANAQADTNARASGSRSGPVLQRNGTMTPKLVSRMKPRTPGSMTKLNVGVNGAGKGKAPMLSLVLEDEDHLYLHHEEDFKNESGLEPVEDDDGDGSPLHFPSSPLKEKSLASPAFETKTPTASNIDSVRKSASPALEMTSPITSTNKLLRPIPVLSPSKFTPHLPPTSSISNVDVGVGETDEREVEELVSSIEQFSSPESRVKRREQRRRRIGLRRNGSENERSADDDNPRAMSNAGIDDNDLVGDKEVNVVGDEDVDEFEASVRQRGIELAEQARRARLRRDREEGRRDPMTTGITRDPSGGNLNETVRPRKEGSELAKWKYKEKQKEKESEKDKDNGSSLQQDEGWFASALRPIPRWLRGNSGVTSTQSTVQTTTQAQDAEEGNEEVTVEEEGQVSSAIAVVDLREEEEESTQDLLMEAQGRMEVVDVGVERDVVVQKEAGEEQGQREEPEQESEPPHESEPMQMVEDVQEITQTTTADEPSEEGMTHKPTSPTPSKPASKAGSDLPIVHEALDLVLPPTASTYQPTPEPSPESPLQDGPEHLGAAMALLNAKSLEISKLDATLLAEQAKTQALSKEVDALQTALQTALVASSSGSRPRESILELELTEARQALVQEKTVWETERNSMVTSIEELKRGQQSAQADRDFFRDQYGQASAFVSSVRKENVELEAQAKRAEEQAKTGVEMIKATFVQRVQWLEEDAQTWRRTAQHLMEMDKRTKGEELRRRAAEAPELRKKCDDLEGKNEELSERLEDLEDEFDAKVRDEEIKRVEEERLQSARIENESLRQVELDNWRSETLRLNVELNEVKAELERVRARVDADVGARSAKAAGVQASFDDEDIVYRCQWRPEGSNDACEGLFLSVEELQNHLFSGGHLHR